jgi:hypothetical protein
MDNFKVNKVNYNLPIPLSKIEGDLWEFLEPYTIEILTESGTLKYNFEKGYQTDLGSIPRWLCSLIDNGSHDNTLLVGYLCHDANFDLKTLSFDTTNDLLKQMIASDGYLQSEAVYWGVEIGGKTAWDNANNPNPLVKFEWNDK